MALGANFGPWSQFWAPGVNFGVRKLILGFRSKFWAFGANLGFGANFGFSRPILGFGANFGLWGPILGFGCNWLWEPNLIWGSPFWALRRFWVLGANLWSPNLAYLGFGNNFGLWEQILGSGSGLGFPDQFGLWGPILGFGLWESQFWALGQILGLWEPILGCGSQFWALEPIVGFGANFEAIFKQIREPSQFGLRKPILGLIWAPPMFRLWEANFGLWGQFGFPPALD